VLGSARRHQAVVMNSSVLALALQAPEMVLRLEVDQSLVDPAFMLTQPTLLSLMRSC
jgi:hypothetical protein